MLCGSVCADLPGSLDARRVRPRWTTRSELLCRSACHAVAAARTPARPIGEVARRAHAQGHRVVAQLRLVALDVRPPDLADDTDQAGQDLVAVQSSTTFRKSVSCMTFIYSGSHRQSRQNQVERVAVQYLP